MCTLPFIACCVYVSLCVLHSSSQSCEYVYGAPILYVVLRQCMSILQLFASIDETLITWQNLQTCTRNISNT